MKKPNYAKWINRQCKKRGLKCLLFHDVDLPDTYKTYIGFKNSMLIDIQKSGTIIYTSKRGNPLKESAKMLYLYKNEELMV